MTSIRKRNFLAITALILSLLGLSAYVLNSASLADRSYEVLAKISNVEKLTVDLERGALGYRITNDAVFLAPFERATADLPVELDALETLVQDNLTQLTTLQQIREDIRIWNESGTTIRSRVIEELPIDLALQVRAKTQMEVVRAHIDTMQACEQILLSARSNHLTWVRRCIMSAIVVAGVFFVLRLIISLRRKLVDLDTSYSAVRNESDRQRERMDVTLSSIGDAVIATDTAGVVTYLNPVAVALTGWPAEEAHGKPIETIVNIIHEQTRDTVDSPITLVLSGGTVVTLPHATLLIAKDGREIPIADSAAPIRDNDGQITGVVMVFRDQTEERKAKKDVAEKMRLLDLTTDAILIRDVEGLIVYWNHGAEQMYGWSSEEAVGKRSHDLLKTEFLKPFEEITEELHRIGHWTGEFVHTTRDGRRINVLARKALDRDSHGKPAAVLQTLTDITERKREDEALARIAAIFDSSNDAILSKDLNGIISSWNAAAERLFGYTANEAIGQPITMLIPPDYADEETHILARIRNGEGIERYETIRRSKDGTLCDVSLTASPVRNREGRIIGASKIVRDITERKRAEEALRESEEKFRTMTNSMPQLAWIAWGDGSIYWYNERWYDYTGTTLEEMEGWGWQSVHHAEALPKVLECWKASIATGDPFEMTFPLRGADGVFRTFLTRVIPLKNKTGQVVQWFGTNTDVEKMKRAEEAVRAAAERFRFLAESMPQKIFTTEPNGDFNYFNRQWYHFTGLTFEQMRGQGWLQFVHIDDMEETSRRWKHSLEIGEYFEMEHRLRRQNGDYRWNVSRAHAMRGGQGETTMWIGSSTDIDDLMRTQEALVHAQAKLANRAVQLESLVEERTSKLSKAHVQLLAEADERKRLEAEIADAVEGEQERLGQELHDGLAQDLTGIGMLLHVLERQLTKPSPAFAAEAGRLYLMVEKAQQDARNLAKSFYPVELQQHGLLVALQNFARNTQERFGISCVVKADHNGPERLKHLTAVQLFRIAQEAVHNAVKHAQAKKIMVTLEDRDGECLLTIKDNGVGLPDNTQAASGMGLRIMHYRARMIGGTVDVRNNDGGGVIVSCVAPAN